MYDDLKPGDILQAARYNHRTFGKEDGWELRACVIDRVRPKTIVFVDGNRLLKENIGKPGRHLNLDWTYARDEADAKQIIIDAMTNKINYLRKQLESRIAIRERMKGG